MAWYSSSSPRSVLSPELPEDQNDRSGSRLCENPLPHFGGGNKQPTSSFEASLSGMHTSSDARETASRWNHHRPSLVIWSFHTASVVRRQGGNAQGAVIRLLAKSQTTRCSCERAMVANLNLEPKPRRKATHMGKALPESPARQAKPVGNIQT